MSALDHAETGGHGSGASDGRLRCSLCNAVGKDEAHRLLESQLAAGDAAFLESLCDPLVWILILLPYADIGILSIRRVFDLLARPPFFKGRADKECLALRREH